ncbi:prepilin-type N-terminal cleavage/methylation domain-containing protein [Halopseudomonas salegens]|uniref:General secretion pathway protein I n=1 Tax=Halopseudomonas salegens TaxID=1434072 RepID=A0A1H2HWI0_9GAMM|nr:prepilin-type N-terminal cleavage/methylation domain-containing protein [Halopseudomonas salegens]SDU36116.1 general secretion pathway protein I [Halopseudomonas salegens]
MNRWWPRRQRSSRRERGFTLLEVLVAFVVATLLLTVLLRAFSSGLTGLARVDRLSMAALVAQSRLAEVGVTEPLQPGTYQGSEDTDYEFSWEVDIRPLDWEYAGLLSDQSRVLYRVEVRVTWPSVRGEQTFVLMTLRNAPLELDL